MKMTITAVLAFFGVFLAHSYGHAYTSLLLGMAFGVLFSATPFYVAGHLVGSVEVLRDTHRTLVLIEKMIEPDSMAAGFVTKMREMTSDKSGVRP